MPEKASERRINYHKDLKKGFCPRCGVKKKKKEIHTYCEDCRSYFRDYNESISAKINKKRKDTYKQRIKNRQCPRCGKKHKKGYAKKICAVCLQKQYSYN